MKHGILNIALVAAAGWVAMTMAAGCAETNTFRDILSFRSAQEFRNQAVHGNGPTLVRFRDAKNCGCKKRRTAFDRIAREYRGEVWFAQVDTGKLPELAAQYAVGKTITTILFADGREVGRLVGKAGTEDYEALLARASRPGKAKEGRIMEKTGMVMFKGDPLTLVGPAPTVGEPAPDFTAVTTDLQDLKLSSLRGKVVLIAAVPSLDTPVCDIEARRFNEQAASLGDDVRVLVISMDLPFAQKRWCAAAGIKNLQTLSDSRDRSFADSYGVWVKELGLLARSIWIVDREGTLRYVELVEEISSEPDYDAALAAVKKLAKQ